MDDICCDLAHFYINKAKYFCTMTSLMESAQGYQINFNISNIV